MHELLREAGGLRDLAARRRAGVARAALRARRAADRDVARGRRPRRARAARRCSWARSAGSSARLRDEIAAGTHTFFVGEVVRVELGEDAPPLVRVRGEYRRGVIEAVVFDLDGVLSTPSTSGTRCARSSRASAAAAGTTRAQADMMGMSSPEWSRYMHDVIGLPESPEEINAEVVRRMVGAVRGAPAADRRRGRGRASGSPARSASRSRRRRTGR